MIEIILLQSTVLFALKVGKPLFLTSKKVKGSHRSVSKIEACLSAFSEKYRDPILNSQNETFHVLFEISPIHQKFKIADYLLIATFISFTFVRKDFLYLGHCNFFQYLVKRGKENL